MAHRAEAVPSDAARDAPDGTAAAARRVPPRHQRAAKHPARRASPRGVRVRLCPQQALSAVARIAVPGAQSTPRVAQRSSQPQPPTRALPEGVLAQASKAEVRAATQAAAGFDGDQVLHLVS